MDKIEEAITLLEQLDEEVTTDTYPASRNYISDHIKAVIDILEEASDAI